MKTKLRKLILSITIFSVLALSTGCYGPFELTKTVHDWNGKATGDKFANSVVFFALCVVQVYSVTLFIDAVVLNTIEFWTGDNPLSMNEGDFDKKIVESDDNIYEITASKNKFHIEKINANNNESIDLIYNSTDGSWNYSDGEETHKLAQGDLNNNEWVKMFYPNGKVETIAVK